MGASKQTQGLYRFAQGQETHGLASERLASPFDLLDIPKFRPATPTYVGAVEVARDRSDTAPCGSGFEIEEQIGEPIDRLGGCGGVALSLGLR